MFASIKCITLLWSTQIARRIKIAFTLLTDCYRWNRAVKRGMGCDCWTFFRFRELSFLTAIYDGLSGNVELWVSFWSTVVFQISEVAFVEVNGVFTIESGLWDYTSLINWEYWLIVVRASKDSNIDIGKAARNNSNLAGLQSNNVSDVIFSNVNGGRQWNLFLQMII